MDIVITRNYETILSEQNGKLDKYFLTCSKSKIKNFPIYKKWPKSSTLIILYSCPSRNFISSDCKFEIRILIDSINRKIKLKYSVLGFIFFLLRFIKLWSGGN